MNYGEHQIGFPVTCWLKVAINNVGVVFFIYASLFVLITKEHLRFIELVVSMVPEKNL